MFRRNPEVGTPGRLKAKSLDDLSSSVGGNLSVTLSNPPSLLSSFVHPAYHPPNTNLTSRGKRQPTLSLTLSDADHCSVSSSDQDSPEYPQYLPSFSLDSSCDTLDGTRETLSNQSIRNTIPKDSSHSSTHYTFPSSTTLIETKENAPPLVWDNMVASTPSTAHPDVHSPISQAMIRASIPQVLMPATISCYHSGKCYLIR